MDPIGAITKSVSGPWTATRLGTTALGLACIGVAAFAPARVIAGNVSTASFFGSVGFLLLGLVFKGPGQSAIDVTAAGPVPTAPMPESRRIGPDDPTVPTAKKP